MTELQKGDYVKIDINANGTAIDKELCQIIETDTRTEGDEDEWVKVVFLTADYGKAHFKEKELEKVSKEKAASEKI